MKITIRKLYVFLIMTILCIAHTVGYAQPPDTLWTKWFGGSGEDYGYDVEECVDGFIVVGQTASFGTGVDDAYVIRLDPDGDTVWTRAYGGDGREQAYSLVQVADGYVFSGYTSTNAQGIADMYLVKFNEDGDTIWTKQYDAHGSTDQGYCISQSSDEGFIIAGFATEYGYGDQVYLVKTDANGDLMWDTTYGGTHQDYARAVQQTPDGGYIIAGYSYSFGGGDADIWLLRTDSSGDTLWTRTYGSPNGDEHAFDILLAPDSGYIIVGTTESFGSGPYDVYVLRTEADGDTLWARWFGGTSADNGQAAYQTNDGNIVIVGSTYSYGFGESDVYLLKIDMDGDLLWYTTFGGVYHDFGNTVRQTSDDEYIIAGRTRSFGAGQSDVYVIRTGPDHGISEGQASGLISFSMQVCPNPFSKLTDISFSIENGAKSVEVKIYDVAGRLVKQWNHPTIQLSNHITWDGCDDQKKKLPSGIYLLSLKTGDHNETKKLILVR